MKRFVAFLLFAALSVSFASCAAGDDTPDDSESIERNTEESVSESEGTSIPPALYEAEPISDMLELAEHGAPPADGPWYHGGNQTRIAKTSHGVYCTYISSGSKIVQDRTCNHYVFVKIENDGSCRQLHDGYYFTDSNSPYIMADKDENVYVVCGGGETASQKKTLNSYIWKYDPTTDEVIEYTGAFPYSVGSGYGYAMGFIDNYANKIYLVNCGGDRKGYFNIVGFDLTTCTYTEPYTFELSEGRHCYLFAFPDGKGGFSLIAQHDVTLAASGHSRKYFKEHNYWANYVWDDLRLFSFSTNENSEIVYNGAVEVDVADYVEESGLFPSNTCARYGDAFMDSSGNIHVIYRSAYEHGIARVYMRHIIINKELEIVYNEELTLDNDYSLSQLKMYEISDGVFYLFVMPCNMAIKEGVVPSGNPEYAGRFISEERDPLIQIYRSEDGISYTKLLEKTLDGSRWYPYHITAAQARNGSVIDNKLSALVAAEYTDNWKYITIDLDTIEAMYKYDLLK